MSKRTCNERKERSRLLQLQLLSVLSSSSRVGVPSILIKSLPPGSCMNLWSPMSLLPVSELAALSKGSGGCQNRSAATSGNIIVGSAGLCCVAEDTAGADAAGVIRDVVIAAVRCCVFGVALKASPTWSYARLWLLPMPMPKLAVLPGPMVLLRKSRPSAASSKGKGVYVKTGVLSLLPCVAPARVLPLIPPGSNVILSSCTEVSSMSRTRLYA